MIYTDQEGLFVDKATRYKRVLGLKTRDSAVNATAEYIDEMVREGLAFNCKSGDGAKELGRFIKFQRMSGSQVENPTAPGTSIQRNS